jgi:hypothetical protein
MREYTVDLTHLDNTLNKRTYKYADVAHRLEKIAFDVVRFTDGDEKSRLWQVQSAEDGDYIVCLYQDEEELPKTSAWEVVLSKSAQTVNVFYKGEQIVALAADKLGIPASELGLVERYLPEKLATNPALVQSLLNELPANTRQAVLAKHRELSQ